MFHGKLLERLRPLDLISQESWRLPEKSKFFGPIANNSLQPKVFLLRFRPSGGANVGDQNLPCLTENPLPE